MFVLKAFATPMIMAFTAEGTGLFAAGASHAYVWNDVLAGGKPLAFNHSVVHSIDRFADGRLLIAGVEGVELHDLRARTVTAVTPFGPRFAAPFAAVAPDGSDFVLNHAVHGRRRLDARSAADPQVTRWSEEISAGCAQAPMFLPHGDRFALIGWEWSHDLARFLTFDSATGRQVDEGPAFPNDVTHPTFSPISSPDRTLIVGCNRLNIGVYRTDDLAAPPILLKNPGRKDVTGLAFTPDGRFLAATSNETTLTVYDTRTWSVVNAYDWGIGRLRSVAFSADGSLGAVGGEKGQVVVFDVDW